MKYRVWGDYTVVGSGFMIVEAESCEEADEKARAVSTMDAIDDAGIHTVHEFEPTEIEEDE